MACFMPTLREGNTLLFMVQPYITGVILHSIPLEIKSHIIFVVFVLNFLFLGVYLVGLVNERRLEECREGQRAVYLDEIESPPPRYTHDRTAMNIDAIAEGEASEVLWSMSVRGAEVSYPIN